MDKISAQEAIAACETLTAFQEMAEGFHSEHPQAMEAVQMRLLVAMVQTYLLGWAREKQEGKDDFDALIAALEGKREFSPEAQAAYESARRASLQ